MATPVAASGEKILAITFLEMSWLIDGGRHIANVSVSAAKFDAVPVLQHQIAVYYVNQPGRVGMFPNVVLGRIFLAELLVVIK
jgi:hypothetical protein